MKRPVLLFSIIIATVFAACACGGTPQTSATTDAVKKTAAEAVTESVPAEEITEAETEQAVEQETDWVEFAGTVHIYNESELRDVLGIPSVDEHYDIQEGASGESTEDEYGVIFLDEPQTMMIAEAAYTPEPAERKEVEVNLMLLDSNLIDEFRQYDGEHHIFSMDTCQAYVYYSDALIVDEDGTLFGPVTNGLPIAVDIIIVE